MDPPPGAGRLLRATDDDAAEIIALVGGAYAEHPGCVLDLPGVDADLVAPRTSIDTKGGDLWVVEEDDAVVACCGWAPSELDGAPYVELKRLYVARPARRSGLGAWLVARVEAVAAERGADGVELWSDSRFADAHRLYQRLGYERLPDTRELHDPSNTTEYHFRKLVRA